MTEIPGMVEKTAINKRVQARYAVLMQEGKHGHYETMFKVVHEERRAAIAAHEAALRDAGMVIVPLEPTREMQDAGDAACLAGAIVMQDDGETITSTPGWIYYEMVKAADTDKSK